MMLLQELDGQWLATAADWINDPANRPWLDFGADVTQVTPLMLRLMTQRAVNCLRLYTAPDGESPIGVVGLSHVASLSRTASLWYVLGDKAYAGRSLTAQAVAQLLDHAFADLGLESVQAWAVEENRASIRVLEKNHFRTIGRQRRCHRLGDRQVDRLLFDLLAREHLDKLCTTTHKL